MKMNQIKTDSALLNTTPGIPSVTAQSKILPYIQKTYWSMVPKEKKSRTEFGNLMRYPGNSQ